MFTEENPFTGNYNGRSHKISNLFMDHSGTISMGLFGFVDGATITGVWLVDCVLTGNDRIGE